MQARAGRVTGAICLAEKIACRVEEEFARRAFGAREVVAADEGDRSPVELVRHKFGRSGEFVGNGEDRGVHGAPLRVLLPAIVGQRREPGEADRDVGDPEAPGPPERVGDDDRQIDPRALAQIWRVGVRRRRPGSSGRRQTNSLATFEASTAALAQTKPWCVSAMISPFCIRTIRAASRSTTSIWRGSLSQRSAWRCARSDGVISRRSISCPSALETILWVTTRRSPSASVSPDSGDGVEDDAWRDHRQPAPPGSHRGQ